MNSYNSDYIVSRTEAEALKDLIFKRAKERAEALANKTQEQYNKSVQNDVMEDARASLTTETNNPFSKFLIESDKFESKIKEQNVEKEKNEGIGFPSKGNDIRKGIEARENIIKEEVVKTEISKNMEVARRNFENKSSFMGALNFLNTQSTIALVGKNGKKFEAVA